MNFRCLAQDLKRNSSKLFIFFTKILMSHFDVKNLHLNSLTENFDCQKEPFVVFKIKNEEIVGPGADETLINHPYHFFNKKSDIHLSSFKAHSF